MPAPVSSGIWVRRLSQRVVKAGGEFGRRGLGLGAEVEGELEGGFVGGGEEFELVECLVGGAEPVGGGLVDDGQESFGGAPEDGGCDGALGDGEEGGVGCGLRFGVADVAGAELAVDFGEGEADAVAVGEGWGGVEMEFGEWDVEGFEEGAELGGFEVELGGVGEVLELASAAGAEVGAGRDGVVSAMVGSVVFMRASLAAGMKAFGNPVMSCQL